MTGPTGADLVARLGVDTAITTIDVLSPEPATPRSGEPSCSTVAAF